MATKTADLFVAVETGVANLNNKRPELPQNLFYFTRGQTRVKAGHPVLKQCPDFFEPVDESVTFDANGRRWVVQ